MKFGKSLLARFGLFTRKTETSDVFALRLDRIGSRERRRDAMPMLFRHQLALLEA